MKAQILLATHNPPPALFTRQLASLAAQTETDWQCLVFDDSSTDRAAVVEQFTDPRFVVMPAREHLGAYRAFEHLLQMADGVPVFLCDQDDFWHPTKLARMLQVPVTAFCSMRVVDVNGSLVRDRFLPPVGDLTPAGLLLMNSVSGAALMVSDRVRRAALPFPAPELRGWHDQWLAAVAARLGELHYLDAPLVDYTQHTSQVVGDGLRRLTGRRLRGFLSSPQLRSRAHWVIAAAAALLELPGPADPDLEAIAAGHFAASIRRHDVPRQRALLLRAGRWL